LETELGTMLFQVRCDEDGLLDGNHGVEARVILERINASTLGRLINNVQAKTTGIDHAAEQLGQALAERNRLSHHFFRQHNNRRNSEEGRALMLADLEKIHETIFAAYKIVVKMLGDDLDRIDSSTMELPTRHLKLD
jgi:hypothetical protein